MNEDIELVAEEEEVQIVDLGDAKVETREICACASSPDSTWGVGYPGF